MPQLKLRRVLRVVVRTAFDELSQTSQPVACDGVASHERILVLVRDVLLLCETLECLKHAAARLARCVEVPQACLVGSSLLRPPLGEQRAHDELVASEDRLTGRGGARNA